MMMLLDMLAAEVTFLHRDAIRRVGVWWVAVAAAAHAMGLELSAARGGCGNT